MHVNGFRLRDNIRGRLSSGAGLILLCTYHAAEILVLGSKIYQIKAHLTFDDLEKIAYRPFHNAKNSTSCSNWKYSNSQQVIYYLTKSLIGLC